MARFVSQLPIYSNLPLKRPGNILVPLNSLEFQRYSKWNYKLLSSCTSDVVDGLVLSPLPPSACFSNTLTFFLQAFCRLSSPRNILCALHSAGKCPLGGGLRWSSFLATWCVLAGGVSFFRARWRRALLSLHTEISNFLTSGAVALVLLRCLPTETDSSDYCLRSERSSKNITRSLCLGSCSFYNTDSAR